MRSRTRHRCNAPTGAAGTLPPVVLIAAGGAAVLVVAAIAAVLVWTNGGDDTTPATADRSLAADSAVLAEISDAVAAIPATAGDTDLEQMRSLLGSPEAFTIALEVDNEGVSTRREEWFYYELRSIYEFVDGTLVSNLPIEAENAFLILPIQYDPDQFELGVTWDQVAETLGGREGMESFTLEPEFELDATVCAGNQLLLMFDEAGLLFYVEAIPFAPDEPQ